MRRLFHICIVLAVTGISLGAALKTMASEHTSTTSIPATPKSAHVAIAVAKMQKVYKKEFVGIIENKPGAWADHYTLIAHALGAIDGHMSTNSIDALRRNYEFGHRVFETDILTTSDGALVHRHDWEKYLYNMLGQKVDKSKDGNPLSLSEFMSLKIHNKYSPLSFKQMVQFMAKHPDVYIVTDTKESRKEVVQKQFTNLVKTVKEVDPSVLDRIIVQLYDENMFKTVNDIYPFKNYIYTLYISLDTDDRVALFASKNNIKVIVMDEKRYSESFVAKLKSKGIYTYINTINSPEKISEYKAKGVRGVMTDTVTPEDLK